MLSKIDAAPPPKSKTQIRKGVKAFRKRNAYALVTVRCAGAMMRMHGR